MQCGRPVGILQLHGPAAIIPCGCCRASHGGGLGRLRAQLCKECLMPYHTHLNQCPVFRAELPSDPSPSQRLHNRGDETVYASIRGSHLAEARPGGTRDPAGRDYLRLRSANYPP